MRGALVLSFLIIGLTGPGFAQDKSQDQAVLDACDQAAASPADSNRPAGVAGVQPWKIDPAVAVPACEAAAKAAPDNARILYQLGRAYGAAKSFELANTQYAKARELGDALATYNLSVHYKGGLGVTGDLARSKALLQEAVDAGAITSMEREWEKAVAVGDSDAMTALGMAHTYGWGFSKDYEIAHTWYEKAAALGNGRAMNGLGSLYYNGWGVPSNFGTAAEWWKKGAAADDDVAMLNYGWIHLFDIAVRRDFDVARSWIEKSAAKGNTSATSKLAALHAYGMGVQVDFGLARMLWEKAAVGGSTEAMANLAWMHAVGRGVTRDYTVARAWYEKAAAAGQAAAMNNLGQFYDYGCGVAQDSDEARRWYEKARASDSPQAAKVADTNLALLNQPAQHRARLATAQIHGCGAIGPALNPSPSSP